VKDVDVAAPSGSVAMSTETWSVAGAAVPAYDRASLPSGARIAGPAIVIEPDSTTWLDDASTATVHQSGALVVRVT
jgi:N-methylhydantoinase A/oxoprolinase/acetone carboxylase beta subunit